MRSALSTMAQSMGSPLRVPASVAANALPTGVRVNAGAAAVDTMDGVGVASGADPAGGAGTGTGAGPEVGVFSGSVATAGGAVEVVAVGAGLVTVAPHAPPMVSTLYATVFVDAQLFACVSAAVTACSLYGVYLVLWCDARAKVSAARSGVQGAAGPYRRT